MRYKTIVYHIHDFFGSYNTCGVVTRTAPSGFNVIKLSTVDMCSSDVPISYTMHKHFMQLVANNMLCVDSVCADVTDSTNFYGFGT